MTSSIHTPVAAPPAPTSADDILRALANAMARLVPRLPPARRPLHRV